MFSNYVFMYKRLKDPDCFVNAGKKFVKVPRLRSEARKGTNERPIFRPFVEKLGGMRIKTRICSEI
jgi:hypothetical protein